MYVVLYSLGLHHIISAYIILYHFSVNYDMEYCRIAEYYIMFFTMLFYIKSYFCLSYYVVYLPSFGPFQAKGIECFEVPTGFATAPSRSPGLQFLED